LVGFLAWAMISVFPEASRLAPGPIQLPVQLVLGALCPGDKIARS